MAFFNPLGAFSAGVGGFMKGKDEAVDRQTKEYDLMGMQALGRAFQLPQGPIPGIPGIGPQGPQAPFPGQPSMPAQPAVQPPGPQVAAAGPPQSFSGGGGGPVGGGMGLNPDTAAGAPYGGAVQPQQIADALARMRQGQGQPTGGFQPQAAVAQAQQQAQAPQQPPMPPQAAPMQPPQQQQPQQRPPQTNEQGMPQFDLQTLVQRIQRANPNLPPQAMVSALTRAVPLLNLQGRQDLAQLRLEMQKQGLDLKGAALDLRERSDDRRAALGERREERLAKKDEQQAATGLSPEAIDDGAQRYLKTGQLPSLGWGAQARQDKAAILNKATELRSAAGLPVDKMIKDQQKLKAEQVAIQRFESGPQGNTTRSLGVVVDHLATLRDLGKALDNGNIPLFNRVAQAWAENTGQPAPTNFDTAKRIVGAEIIKALGVAGAGTAEERKEAADAFSRARSPDQIDGAIKTAQKLLVGQVKGLRRQFVQSTGLPGEAFDNMLGPEAKNFLNVGSEGGGTQSGGGGGGGGNANPVTSGGWSIQRVQ